MFAVDGGSTQGVCPDDPEVRPAGQGRQGRRLRPHADHPTASSPPGNGDFTIDQQPYLQGFLPVLELYIYQASKHLSGIADVNTGLKFLNKKTVVPYNSTKSRYEGTKRSAGRVVDRSSRSAGPMSSTTDSGAPAAAPAGGPAQQARGPPRRWCTR